MRLTMSASLSCWIVSRAAIVCLCGFGWKRKIADGEKTNATAKAPWVPFGFAQDDLRNRR